VTKDRDPELFAALDNDVSGQIALPKSQIENALKTKYRNVSIGFAEDSEVSAPKAREMHCTPSLCI
jgi:hypothetical protein